MKRNLVVATGLLLTASLLPTGEAIGLGNLFAPSHPTSLGEVLVGLDPESLSHLSPGDRLGGLAVLAVREQGSYVVLAADDLQEARAALAGEPGIRYVEDNARLDALGIPNDARYGEQYGPEMMGAHAAWDQVGFGSSEVIVAVLDTGIRRSHEDFQPNRLLQGYDHQNNDADPADDCDHGTHVAGTIAATTGNGKGVAGMSQATILPYKVLGPLLITCAGSTDGIAQAIYDATEAGAHIISMSLGGGGTETFHESIQHAWSEGVTIVAAAGNSGSDGSVLYPAAYPEVIAVSALDESGGLASYSSYGPEVEISAPGSNVLSTIDDSDSAYRTMSGTSMATPHVAGALALALSCAPHLENEALRQLLHETAEDKGPSGWDKKFGHGLARVDQLVGAACDGNTTPPPPGPDPDPDPEPDPEPGPDPQPDPDPEPDPEPSPEFLLDIEITVSSGQWSHHTIEVPPGVRELTVTLSELGCTGIFDCDADLYVKQGQEASVFSYDCHPIAYGVDERCRFENPGAGAWGVAARGCFGEATVRLQAIVA